MMCTEPMKIQVADTSLSSEGLYQAPPPGLEPLAPPPGLVGALESSPPGVLGVHEKLSALQNDRLVLETAMLSHAQARAMQSLVYQNMMRQAYPQMCGGFNNVGVACPKRATVSSRASTASGDGASSDSGASDDGLTTLIIKKMPKAFTRGMLLALMDRHGYQGKYDFVYIPVDFDKCLGTGCGFVDFIDTESAERFQEQFEGYRNWGVRCSSSKCAEISWSQACQGKQNHMDRYRNSPVMHPSVPEEFKPVVFTDGVRVSMPPPTRLPKAPRA